MSERESAPPWRLLAAIGRYRAGEEAAGWRRDGVLGLPAPTPGELEYRTARLELRAAALELAGDDRPPLHPQADEVAVLAAIDHGDHLVVIIEDSGKAGAEAHVLPARAIARKPARVEFPTIDLAPLGIIAPGLEVVVYPPGTVAPDEFDGEVPAIRIEADGATLFAWVPSMTLGAPGSPLS